MKLPHPKLLVLSAPSGTGKTTIITELLALFQEGLKLSVSYTTRQPRPGEVEGVNYHFVDKKQFVRRIHEGDFLEWAEVHGNYYGTSKSQIQEYLSENRAIILDVDVQGALQLMEKSGLHAEFIFLSPPSLKELKKRLKGRGTENKEDLKIRLNNARMEMEAQHQYQHQLVNKDLDQAILDFALLILQLCSTEKGKSDLDPKLIPDSNSSPKAQLEEISQKLKSIF